MDFDAGTPGANATAASRAELPELAALGPHLRHIWEGGDLHAGNYVLQLEEALASGWAGRCVHVVPSATAGLVLALRALEVCGEVLMPSCAEAMCAHAIQWAGCEPVFVDSDLATLTIDAADAARRVTSSTRALLVSCTNGNPPDIDRLEALARERGLHLILEGVQARNAKAGGEDIARRADAAVLGLPHGAAVAISVRDPEVAARLAAARGFGDGDPAVRVLDATPNEVMALVALAAQRRAPAIRQARERLHAALRLRLGEVTGVELQREVGGNRADWEALGVRIVAAAFGAPRSAVRHELRAAGIETRSPFDPPLHRRRLFAAHRARTGPLPVADRLAAEALVIPIDRLEFDDVERIAGCFAAAAAG